MTKTTMSAKFTKADWDQVKAGQRFTQRKGRETMQLPSISYPTDRPNFTEVTIGDITVWYSYSTPVAFYTSETGKIVRENDWAQTTGRHLNYIDGGNRSARLPSDQWVARLNETLHRLGLASA